MQEDTQQDKPQFSASAMKQVEEIFSRYPDERRASALMPVLHLAQSEFGGWLSRPALDYVAEVVGVAPIRCYEVATFYTMYNLKPVGKYHVQVCTNIACWLCDSDNVVKVLEDKVQAKMGGTTQDNRFTLSEVECLGACINAPMMQVNDDYYENLTADRVAEIIDRLP
ncbi:MAG: NADH-quinone oxidoreductase subunit NuoE [Magnetococcales bacterium]|nr:NADH-quinone oxidoreductase subunit NuoE [Magnetococcales bacterium]